MLHAIKKMIPKPLLQLYHYMLAKVAAFIYRYPSEDLIVIGVTGTNGKSSTVQFIAQILTEMGHKVGYTTTAGFFIAGEEIENKMKMTMPGRFYLQQLVKNMVKAGCEYAIVETSSEGIKQFRHLGINYDVAVLTNLTPEHIESHGSFEQYRLAKGQLFSHLTNMRRKKIDGEKVQKVSVVNIDDEHADFFTAYEADDLITFSWSSKEANIKARTLQTPLQAKFQMMNAAGAVAAVVAAGLDQPSVIKAAKQLKSIPGRFESIDKNQPFNVIVDYAYEPYALEALYEAVGHLKPERLIGVHGSAGGGRDKSRRFVIGKLAAEKEDVVIVTNEDPYDEDPREIIEEVARGAIEGGKIEDKNLHLIDDRQDAIDKAMELAREGDVVVLTGKGSEPVMAVAAGKKVPWSDKEAALKALAKRGYV